MSVWEEWDQILLLFCSKASLLYDHDNLDAKTDNIWKNSYITIIIKINDKGVEFGKGFMYYPMVWRGVWCPPFNLGSPAIQVPKVPPLRIPILHLIPWNSPNGGMDEGYIWVWPTESKMQVEGKISSNKKD